jgi:hypothetical protein
MTLPEARKPSLLAFCRLDELSAEEELLLEVLYCAAVGYMTQAGVREPPEDTPRRAQYDLCVNYLVLDGWDPGGTSPSWALPPRRTPPSGGC